jgi:hypothetical protein
MDSFVFYGCEILSQILRKEHRLRVFENRVLKRIFGPRKDEVIGGWRKLYNEKKKLHGLSPRANYADRATAACRRSDCQLLRIEGATWSAWRIPTAVFSVF